MGRCQIAHAKHIWESERFKHQRQKFDRRLTEFLTSNDFLTLSVTETKIAEFANSVDLDDVAHHEPHHLDLHCLPSDPQLLNMIYLVLTIFLKFADENFVICFSVVKELS